MTTTTELAATEAIKRGYRSLREDIATLLNTTGTSLDGHDATVAAARMEAVLPLMEALTGRTREQIKASVVKRLRKDGRA